ncbi:hypothetical protein ACQ438_003236 [Escherichia coli O13,129, 135:H26]
MERASKMPSSSLYDQ